MAKISIREDGNGARSVRRGRTILMDGLGEDEAANVAAFFRAADRFLDGRFGQGQPAAAPSASHGTTGRRDG